MKESWTPEQFKHYIATGKKPDSDSKALLKYGNKKTDVDDIVFDSAKEAKRWGELKLLHKAKMITKPIRQYSFVVSDKVEYIADFLYFDYTSKSFVVEDVKGYQTDVYKIKNKLMLANLNIEIKEI